MESEVVEAYFRLELLYAHLLELLSESSQASGDSADCVGLQTAERLLTVAQTERLVREPLDVVQDRLAPRVATGRKGERSSTALLGLTPESVRRAHGLDTQDRMAAQEAIARQALLPKLEQRLHDQCTDVCELVIPSLLDAARRHDSSADGAMTASRIAELPALLLELESRKTHLERENAAAESNLRVQLVKDIELCKEMAGLVTSMLIDHQRNDQPRALHTKVQWLAASAKAMRAKAQVMVDELTLETYPAQAIPVLRATHDALIERKQRALEEREQLRTKLGMHRDGDAQYQEIARQYGIVLRGIDEKKSWLSSLNV